MVIILVNGLEPSITVIASSSLFICDEFKAKLCYSRTRAGRDGRFRYTYT